MWPNVYLVPYSLHYHLQCAPMNNNLQLNIYDQKSQQNRRNKEIICINRRIIYREKTHCICCQCSAAATSSKFLFFRFSPFVCRQFLFSFWMIFCVFFSSICRTISYSCVRITNVNSPTAPALSSQDTMEQKAKIWKTEVSGRFRWILSLNSLNHFAQTSSGDSHNR